MDVRLYQPDRAHATALAAARTGEQQPDAGGIHGQKIRQVLRYAGALCPYGRENPLLFLGRDELVAQPARRRRCATDHTG